MRTLKHEELRLLRLLADNLEAQLMELPLYRQLIQTQTLVKSMSSLLTVREER